MRVRIVFAFFIIKTFQCKTFLYALEFESRFIWPTFICLSYIFFQNNFARHTRRMRNLIWKPPKVCSAKCGGKFISNNFQISSNWNFHNTGKFFACISTYSASQFHMQLINKSIQLWYDINCAPSAPIDDSALRKMFINITKIEVGPYINATIKHKRRPKLNVCLM